MRSLRRALLVVVALGAILLLSLLTQLFGPGPGAGRETEPPPPVATRPPAGRVLGGGGGPAPADLRVAAITPGGPVPAEVAPDGTFTLPEGTKATAYEATAGSLRVRVGAGADPVTIRLPDRQTVAGRVVDEGSGEAVAGASVACGEARGRCGPRGRFRLEGVRLEAARLPPIRVSAGGYADLVLPTEEPRAWDDLFLRLIRR